jgi:hypothetical protein
MYYYILIEFVVKELLWQGNVLKKKKPCPVEKKKKQCNSVPLYQNIYMAVCYQLKTRKLQRDVCTNIASFFSKPNSLCFIFSLLLEL